MTASPRSEHWGTGGWLSCLPGLAAPGFARARPRHHSAHALLGLPQAVAHLTSPELPITGRACSSVSEDRQHQCCRLSACCGLGLKRWWRDCSVGVFAVVHTAANADSQSASTVKPCFPNIALAATSMAATSFGAARTPLATLQRRGLDSVDIAKIARRVGQMGGYGDVLGEDGDRGRDLGARPGSERLDQG